MGEESEIWQKYREERKEKKLNNEKSSIELLRRLNIDFEILSEQSKHYRVGGYSFWPTTGKFYHPITGDKGRGIRNLISKIDKSL